MAKRKISVEIVGDERDLVRAFRSSADAGRKWSVSMGTIAKSAIGFAAVTKAIDVTASAIRGSVAEFSEQQKVAAQTQAVLRSTGSAAGVTAKQVDRLAGSISAYSGIDDEAVTAGENMLLTFTQVQNRVGKGNAIFDQATKATADLSVAMGIDMKRAALQVGKALNDPERGYARLQRIGVAFTKSQVAQIKAFTKTGQTAKAQKVILAELNKEFGGSARALGQTLPGQVNRFRETLRNVGGDLVGKVAPAFTRALETSNKFVTRLSEAKSIHAKFSVVFGGIEGVGRELYGKLAEQIRKIDVPGLVSILGEQLSKSLNGLAGFLNSANFRAVGKAVGDGILVALRGLGSFFESTDWGIVGRRIVQGIGDFLKGVDWKAVFVASFRLTVAALKASSALLRGAATEIGRGVVRAIGAGMREVGQQLEKVALRIVLRIVEPFTHLPKRLGGGPFQEMKDELKAKLAGMESDAQSTAEKIGKTFGLTFLDLGKKGKKSAPAVAKETARAVSTVADTQVAAIKKTAKATDQADRAAKARRRREAEQARRQGLQFTALGLDPSGSDRVPTVSNLKKQLSSVAARLGSSTTPRLKAQLAAIGKVLDGAFGKVTKDTRAKIKELFDTIRQGFDQETKKGPLTNTSGLNTKKVLAGLGLSPEQTRALRGRLSHFNTAGSGHAGQAGVAFAGGPLVVESHTTVTMDGHVVGKTVTRQQQKTKRRNPPQRRGPNREI